MRTLVLGASGLLGSHLIARLGLPIPVRVDITQPTVLRKHIAGADVVINCAAWTAVDAAERDEEAARMVNAHAVAALTHACADQGAWLFHISTDFVFSGDSSLAYLEAEPVNPIGAYGRTKAEGEVAVLNYERGSIIRTAWLYGRQRTGFIPAVLSRARHGLRFPVVDDQLGQPTFVGDASERIMQIVQQVAAFGVPTGIWHATNSGSTSRWHLASVVLSLTGANPDLVMATSTRVQPGVALRPRSSALADTRGATYGLPPMRPWLEALTEALPTLSGS